MSGGDGGGSEPGEGNGHAGANEAAQAQPMIPSATPDRPTAPQPRSLARTRERTGRPRAAGASAIVIALALASAMLAACATPHTTETSRRTTRQVVSHDGSVTTAKGRYIVNLTVRDGEVDGFTGPWKVHVGESLVLQFVSGKDDTIEAPGLEYRAKVKGGDAVGVHVTPMKAGTFEFRLVDQGILLGTLEVEP